MSVDPKQGRERADPAAKKTKVQSIKKPVDQLDKGLPSSPEAERCLLGSVLLDDSRFGEVARLDADDFSLESHRRIFRCMQRLQTAGEHLDYVTVFDDLGTRNELERESLSFLASLTDGIPHQMHLESYLRIVLKKSKLRRAIFALEKTRNECLSESTTPDEILATHLAEVQELTQRGDNAREAIADIPSIRECGGPAIEFLHEPELPRGAVVAFTGDSGSGKSTLLLSWAAEISAAGTPVLILDRDNPLSAIVERFDRLGIVDERLIRYWGGWRTEEAAQPDAPEVIAWVKSCEREPLVIVDCMVAFHGGDENDASQTRAFMRRCRRLAHLGCTVIVIHHDGKAETAKDYRGSSDFKAAVDAAFHVSNVGTDGKLGLIRLRCYKSRFGFAGEIVYQYVSSGQGHRFVREQDRSTPSRSVTEQLTELLRNNPGVTAAQFERFATEKNLGRNRARQFLNEGLQSGRVRREPGNHNKRLYYLPETEGA